MSTSVEQDVADRLNDLARVDNRSLAQIAALAIQHGLSVLEEEHAEKLNALRETSQPAPPPEKATTAAERQYPKLKRRAA